MLRHVIVLFSPGHNFGKFHCFFLSVFLVFVCISVHVFSFFRSLSTVFCFYLISFKYGFVKAFIMIIVESFILFCQLGAPCLGLYKYEMCHAYFAPK